MIVCTVALTHKFIIRLKADLSNGYNEPHLLQMGKCTSCMNASSYAEDEGNGIILHIGLYKVQYNII